MIKIILILIIIRTISNYFSIPVSILKNEIHHLKNFLCIKLTYNLFYNPEIFISKDLKNSFSKTKLNLKFLIGIIDQKSLIYLLNG
jgi:hypothetical protein